MKFLEESTYVGRATLYFIYVIFLSWCFAIVLNHGMVPEIPFTPKRNQLNKAQKIQVYTFTRIHWSPRRITVHLNITQHQIRYTQSYRLTPQKQRCGSKPYFDRFSRTRLIYYIRSSKKKKRMRYCDFVERMGWDVSKSIIRQILQKKKLHRRVARKKPPIY